jgi:hypothetical protein
LELEQLRREVVKLKAERDILKKNHRGPAIRLRWEKRLAL